MTRAHVLPALMGAVLLTGCSSSQEASPTGSVVVGPEYSAGKGLYVPVETRRSIGLEIAEVDQQQVAATLEFSLYASPRPNGPVQASGRVPSDHAPALRVGEPVAVRLPNGTTLAGRLTEVAPAAGFAGMTDVVVALPAADGLAAGTFLRGTLTEQSPRYSASIPRSSLVWTTEGDFVYTTSGEHFVRIPVTVGALSKDRAIIKEGLYAGDRVVAAAAMSLWMTELAATKGGHSCCAVPPEGK